MTQANDIDRGPLSAVSLDIEQEHERLGVLFAATKNPVFVWEALAIQHVPRLRARLTESEVPPVIIPEWAQEYLAASATKVVRIARGMDLRTTPGNAGHFDVRPTEGKASMDLVPGALSLTVGKKNMFTQYRTTKAEIDTALWLEHLQGQGLRYVDALEKMAETAGAAKDADIPDASAIRKRATAGGKLLKLIRSIRIPRIN